MKCRCHHPANRLVLAGPAAVADLSELPHFDGRQYSEWKLKTVRQRMGNVSIDPEKLVEAVDAMGGLGAVEGKQSVKGNRHRKKPRCRIPDPKGVHGIPPHTKRGLRGRRAVWSQVELRERVRDAQRERRIKGKREQPLGAKACAGW